MKRGVDASVAARTALAPLAPMLRAGVLAILVAMVGIATALLAFFFDGDPGATAAPVLLATAVYAACRAPLRWSATALVFLLLALDDYGTALGLWHTPWAIVREMLVQNVDRVFPSARGFKLNGIEMVGVLLVGIAAWRRATGVTLDSRGRPQTASVLVQFGLVYLLAVGLAVVNGVSRGGSMDIVIWQARPLLHTFLLLFLFLGAFRGARDIATVGRLVVVSALLKALLAIWVYWMFRLRDDALACATSHGDSLLFSVACTILLANFMERTDRRRLTWCALLLPLLFYGMYANNRRLVWVQLLLSLVAAYLLSPWSRWKRSVTRFAVVAAPVLVLYAAAGWNSTGGKTFAPVRVLRSVIDAKGDRSTFFRSVENWNLAVGLSYSPIIGKGFGHEFFEFYPMDDITRFFPQYHAQPHNQVLGLLLFGGLASFTGIWLLYAVGVFLAVRTYRIVADPVQRAGALCCYATILAALIDAYGDLGPYNVQNKVLMALALAMIGKLAVTSGAWPARIRAASRRGDAGASAPAGLN